MTRLATVIAALAIHPEYAGIINQQGGAASLVSALLQLSSMEDSDEKEEAICAVLEALGHIAASVSVLSP